MADYDAIVVGAGHNGLSAGTILAKEGLKVLVLEKQRNVGGMAATQEFFKGFKHNVGAWALMVHRDDILEALEIHKYGFDVIEPKISICNFGTPGEKPYLVYNDSNRLMEHLREDHGEDAVEALGNLYEMLSIFGQAWDTMRRGAPKSIGNMIESMPTANAKDVVMRILFGTCVDLINECFPDPTRHKNIQGSLATMGIDGTGLGPYCPGTAFSLAYHFVAPGVGNYYKLVKGGTGNLSEALRKSFEANGGEVRLATAVKNILIENGKAAGVELRNGEKITSKVVLCSLDARATFIGLVGEDNLPSDFTQMVKRIKYRNPYLEIHVTLKEPPEFDGNDLAVANDPHTLAIAYIPSPEHLERCYDDYKWGRIPEDVYSAFYIPSRVDDSLAPPGYHTATFFSQYFPLTAPRDTHDRLKEEMADRVIEKMNLFAPNLKDAITDRVVFTPMHYEKMFGATEGDYASGLQLPEQMFDSRPVTGWSGYDTPIANLFMCGAACHPGPGVTCTPGFNSANEVLKQWKS